MNHIDIEDKGSYSVFRNMRDKGLVFQYVEDKEYQGRSMTINNQQLLNFANCCYLGLEKHPSMIDAAIEAVKHYGTQNPVSRAMISSPLYKELEDLLQEVFQSYPIFYSSSTLTHYSVLPLIANRQDAIILDAFVHNSVRVASQICKANGTFVLASKHNDIENVVYLAKRLKKEGYRKVWYCADGVYSMHGNYCNYAQLFKALDAEENLFAYIDDAHGSGWCGKNGCGSVIENFGHHPKLLVTASLAKSFGAAGSVMLTNDAELADYIKLCSSTMIFSLPMQPASVGAIIASLKLHLSTEIQGYQLQLLDLIRHFKAKSLQLGLPLLTKDETPIQLIRVGETEEVIATHEKLIKKGFFTSTAIYPGVIKTDQGLRISITRHLTKADINNLLENIDSILKQQSHGKN